MSLAHKRIRIVCLLLIVGLLLTGIGVAFGRYSSTIRDTILFQAQQSDPARAITIQSDGWRTTTDSAALTFSLTSGVEGQQATLRLTATEGFPAESVVTLTVDGETYTAEPQAVTAGDPLYDKMGAGVEYRFYDAGAERVWAVTADTTYTLTVIGQADASLLRLTATEA